MKIGKTKPATGQFKKALPEVKEKVRYILRKYLPQRYKFYVGKTSHPPQRFKEHEREKGDIERAHLIYQTSSLKNAG